MTAKPAGSDAATRELCRVAETGELEELVRLFSSGADVNARNEHGMTPLMKAASHGREQMVRALLENGADPNLARDDKFTALALAAFFGHTKTVKILIQHGARTEAVTRCGTSAQTWATRRTFIEAARCLDSHAPELVSAPAAVIRTLKDPPEIWDLVHEAPRGFNATSAFVARLRSMQPSLALRIAVLLAVSTAGVVGMLVLRGSQASSLSVEAPAIESPAPRAAGALLSVESNESETPAGPGTPEVDESSPYSESSSVDNKPSRKVVFRRQVRSRVISDDKPAPAVESLQSRAVTAVGPVIAKPRVETREPSSRANNGLSPQLISPARNSPRKAKVIQWP